MQVSVSTKAAWQRALVLGAVAGMRTFLAPAMLSANLHQRETARHSDTPSSWLASRWASRILGLLSAAELLGDKLPVMPSRLDPAPLLARGLSGAIVGSAVFDEGKGSRLAGALLGMGAALGAAVGAYHARQWIGKNLHLPDVVVAAGEDALAVSAARSALPVNSRACLQEIPSLRAGPRNRWGNQLFQVRREGP